MKRKKRAAPAHLRRKELAAAVAVALLFPASAQSTPTGGQVVAGQASIGTPASGAMTITQTTPRAAINWQSFGIAANESVRFNQPSASAITLNRVLGQAPSAILGSLSANGQVFILNPNGVLFGAGAQVNVGGLVASTLDLSPQDFMNGRYVFAKGATAGSVVNQGTIGAADGGYVALIGPQVRNEGIITATLGSVALAAGEQVTLNLNGNSLVGLTVDRGAVDALAKNRQLIRADGGQVILTAKAADALIRSVVNNEGVIEANTLAEANGVIRLTGDLVSHTGTIRARGGDAGGDGGLIAVSGKEIALEGVVDTRAPHGKTGLLVLDPNNVEITSGAATLAGATTISAATLTTALSASNVVVHTAGADGEDGDIRISEAVSYSSANALSFLAHRHIEANASVQNDGAGALNLVAGWDGATGFTATPGTQQQNGTVDIAAILATPSSFGNNAGSVFINKADGTGAVGVSVGSRDGTTTVAAHDLTLRGGDTTNSAYAQLGHGGNDADGNRSGAVTVNVNGDLSLTGGGSVNSYVQLGHGGNDADGNHSGAITVTVGGDLSLTGGTNLNAYAQLGHGGRSADSDHSGTITVTVNGNLSLAGGGEDAYAQLGHGGFGAIGNHSGDITVDVNGNLSLTGGGIEAYAQLGHGGFFASGNHSGAITVTVGGDLSLTGGVNAYAQVGHGDAFLTSSGTRTGALDLSVTGETSLKDVGSSNIWFLGHRTATAGGVTGADIAFATGTLDYTAGTGATDATLNQAFADRFGGNLAGGSVTVTANGLAGNNGDLVNAGAWSYTSANALTLVATRDVTLNAAIANAGAGDIVLAAGRDFFNATGSTALATDGRWLVYSTSPAASTEDGLTGAAGGTMPRLYNLTYAGNPPNTIAAGNHLIYSTQPALSVTADDKTKVYGDANPALTGTFSGFLADDGVTDDAASAGVTGAADLTTTATAASTVADGPYVITAATGTLASSNGYTFNLTNGNLAVTPRPVTVAADAGQNKVYGNADPGAYSFTNTSLGAGVALAGALDRAAGENVGSYAIGQGTLTNAANPNYTITFAGDNFTITPRPVTVTADAGQTKVYGNADPVAFAFGNTSLGSGAALVGALDRAAGENVGNYAIGQGTLTNAANPNYTITFAGDNFAITPRPLTITADDKARGVGEANPPFTATYAGFAFAEGLGNLTGAPLFATPATATSPLGNYAITVGGLSSTNYAITYMDGVLTVGTPAPATAARAAGDAISTVYKVEDASLQVPETSSNLLNIVGSGIRLPEGVAP